MPSILDAPSAPPKQEPVTLRPIDSIPDIRHDTFAKVEQTVKELPPVQNQLHTLRLKNVRYEGPEKFSLKDYKKAILENKSLYRRLRGTYELLDNTTGKKLDERDITLAHVPYLTDHGTFVFTGIDHTLCLHGLSQIWTEHGLRRIEDLVKNREKVNVWSYDFWLQKFVLRPITGWHKRLQHKELKVARFAQLQRCPTRLSRSGFKSLWITPNHLILDTEGNKKAICESSSITQVEEKLSYSQTQLLYGSLLGDAHLSQEGMLSWNHCWEQRSYARMKRSILGQLTYEFGIRADKQGKSGVWKDYRGQSYRTRLRRRRPFVLLRSRACPEFHRARSLCYAGIRKTVSRTWLDKLDAMGLAFWFGDDGSTQTVKNCNSHIATFHTNCFSRDEVEIIKTWLLEKFGLESYRERDEILFRGRDCGWVIRLPATSARRLFDLISPFLPHCLHYKLALTFLGGACRSCGKKGISRHYRQCNRCILSDADRCGGGSLPRQARDRFGGTTAVREMVRSGTIPQDSAGEDAATRREIVSVSIPAMIRDNSTILGLEKTEFTYCDEPEKRFAASPWVYDLTVDGTHNYVANGVLVSNSNQLRMRPGVYARQKGTGEYESHLNIHPGKGLSHRIIMDPDNGAFYFNSRQARLPLYPILKEMGLTDADLQKVWGPQILENNIKKADSRTLERLHAQLSNDPREAQLSSGQKGKNAIQRLLAMEVDPEVTARTMKEPFHHISPDLYLAITQRLMRIQHGEEQPDDRDHLAYQQFMGPDDLIAERFKKAPQQLRQALWKISNKRSLKTLQPGFMNKAVQAAIYGSGLGNSLEEVNPAELMDQTTRISRMGYGGIPSTDSIPLEARAVQPSSFGFLDPIRTPESLTAGVDLRAASGLMKGSDGRIYAPFINPRTGQTEFKSPQDLADATITFPGELGRGKKHVNAIVRGQMDMTRRRNVDYVLPPMEHSFNALSNLVPFKSATAGQRVAMGSRMLTQAVGLVTGESPLVQNAIPNRPDVSYEELHGGRLGAIHSKVDGRVVSVKPGEITIRKHDGEMEKVETYDNLPFNRKSFLHNTAMVVPGQPVRSGDLLAKSNFTDDKGNMALGLNLRTAYLPARGWSFEDAYALSESAAKKFSSEHAFQNLLEHDEKIRRGKKAFLSLYPTAYNRKQLETLDEEGVAKPGTVVAPGDPLIIAARENELTHNKILRPKGPSFSDASIQWDHDAPGMITDVAKTPKGTLVVVKSTMPLKEGDKISGLYGNKGLVGRIIPDDQMPHDQDGRPFELLANPLGVITRGNPAQVHAALLGKIAAATGKPYKISDFGDVKDWTQHVQNELTKHGISDTEDLIDPETGVKIPDVLTGNLWTMKLHHLAESKIQGRGIEGGYTSDESPAKHGDAASKRLALAETYALLSHGALGGLAEKNIRGQKNLDWWAELMAGHVPGKPGQSFAYQKLLNFIKAGGVNPLKRGTQIQLMPMTDAAIDELAGDREVQNAQTVRWDKGLKPIEGGLFDPTLTGGHAGSRWAKLSLAEPMPNPVFEEPIRRLLGLTKEGFRDVLAGKTELDGKKGPEAVQSALQAIDIHHEIAQARTTSQTKRGQARDDANKRLAYLKVAEAAGLHPKDWMLTRAPILPPRFRPVSLMQESRRPLVADINYLYHDLIEANDNLRNMKQHVTETPDERLALYDAFKAVVGLGDPVSAKNQEKNVKGLLKTLFGSSPKYGAMQRKLLSGTMDLVGRAAIIPHPDLDLDEVGLPEEKAWTTYKPFVIRNLVRAGADPLSATRQFDDKTPAARKALERAMGDRPVVLTRAPVLHRYGVMAFWPKLFPGDTIRLNPFVTKGFGADFDGDAMNWHVMASEEGNRDAIERMLPSKNLFSTRNFRVHQLPINEFAAGLYQASVDMDNKRPEELYASIQDALNAFAQGRIRHNQRVAIAKR